MSTANGGTGTGTEEQKRKTNDSFLKNGGQQNMSRSPRLCTPIKKELSENLPNDNVIGNQDNGNRNYKSKNPDLVTHPHNSIQTRNQLTVESKYNDINREVVSKVEEQIPFRLSKVLKGKDFEVWDLKPLSGKTVNQTIISNNAHLISSITQSTSSAYNYPQLIVKQTRKGKEVICEDLKDKSFSIVGGHKSLEDEKSFAVKFQSDTLRRSNVVDDDDDDNKPLVEETVSVSNEINLREWLKSECHSMKKLRKIHIFKQVLELVDFAHSQGLVLLDFWPSCFTLLSSSKIKYIGSYGQQRLGNEFMTCNVTRKRPLEQNTCACQSSSTKQQKLFEETGSSGQSHKCSFTHGFRTIVNQTDSDTIRSLESRSKDISNCQHTFTKENQFMSGTIPLEEKWYCSPEMLNDGVCTLSSNIYSLGILLFELLCNIESREAHSTAMLELCHRILPPKFLAENPKEAGFCLWLLHPEPSSRPNARIILESEFIQESEESSSIDDVGISDDEAETDKLLHFLTSLKEEKMIHASKLEEQLNLLNEDIQEVERRYSFGTDSVFPLAQMKNSEVSENILHFQDSSSSDISRSIQRSFGDEERFMANISQLENSYFSTRIQVLSKDASSIPSNDKNLMENRWRLPQGEHATKEPRRINTSVGCLGSFFEGLCKFARYSKLEERGRLRNRDLLSSSNVMCALSFDRDEDYMAAGGVSKKIKIFDLNAISSDSVDIQYPLVEMTNKSKLSCVCWNTNIRNHLASTDYDGVVQMWDADTGQPLSQYMEHQKRAWSVHFSLSDPKMFASGSDDCSVKLWNISEKNSLGTIWNPANICCVQFSSYSTNLLFFGSADYKVYGYDLRHTRIPWCTLAGHGKAVSYVKFIDAEAVVSASTDNSLKLWDLKKASSSGLSSDSCVLNYKGHSNEKNFVGLSVLDGYIACGSESNEVYCYHKSLPVPIASHKFESIDPISGHVNSGDNSGQFVSSVCWRNKSNMLVAANSVGIVKLLQMV
ncbi:protein SUPPRESSOR OF PHYA-105 1 isoform X2 [Vigna radiata var. radiata]|uniref:Protein SUPPRESSOR OF PHYA-105 1 isoform X2 n=1 Tax=Vigna radiata var. radiata TaxID=3916 RepID=A0A3Q0FCF6_VIGRR|nr:protein SUPPRESSOR OF PHYA-105 1 isoform X2 [Vigna radiata var. radiata]